MLADTNPGQRSASEATHTLGPTPKASNRTDSSNVDGDRFMQNNTQTTSAPRRFRRLLLVSALSSAAALATGCYREGGYMHSDDTYTYISRPGEPKTISVIDWTTGDTVWSHDLPVGRKLVIRFSKNQGIKDSPTPDLLMWEEMRAERTGGHLTNKQPVPNAATRRLEMTLRPRPEFQTFSAQQPATLQEPVVPLDRQREPASETPATTPQPTNNNTPATSGDVRRTNESNTTTPQRPPIDLD